MLMWAVRYRATGIVAPSRIGGHQPRHLELHHERVQAPMAETTNPISRPYPRSALFSVVAHEQHLLDIGILRCQGLRNKNAVCPRADKGDGGSQAGAVAGAAGLLNMGRPVFVDETGIKAQHGAAPVPGLRRSTALSALHRMAARAPGRS